MKKEEGGGGKKVKMSVVSPIINNISFRCVLMRLIKQEIKTGH